MADITESRVAVNGIEYAYLASGDDGPLAVCLHGFPDTAWSWRHLLPRLADAGYRAVAPWLRGYAPTGLDPEGRYQNGASVVDVVALHSALGGDGSAVLIGHDWGARIATGAAALEPALWSKVVTAAVPPAGAVAQGFLTFDQLKRSWYMFFFQSPLADAVVGMNARGFIGRLWQDWSPGYDAEAAGDLDRVVDSIGAPDRLAAALGYYRATVSGKGVVPEFQAAEAACSQPVPQPHLYLHGADDGCLGVEIARLAEPFMTTPGSRMEIIDDAGHFLQLEQPKLVNDLILNFLAM